MNIITPRPQRAGSVDFVDGHTRLYGILGHPIEQVRSPETVTFELRRRGINAILVPLHVKPADFDEVFPRLLKLGNLDGWLSPCRIRGVRVAIWSASGHSPNSARVFP
jgi:shikimate dehydrogenase